MGQVACIPNEICYTCLKRRRIILLRRFASLFNSYVGLQSALEDARDLLLIGADCRGIAPLRAALEWTPVQAHATAHRVRLYYAAQSATSAAYLKDWWV